MKARKQIRYALFAGILAMFVVGCGSSDPEPDSGAQAQTRNDYAGTEHITRGMRAVGEARELEQLINGRQARAMQELER